MKISIPIFYENIDSKIFMKIFITIFYENIDYNIYF